MLSVVNRSAREEDRQLSIWQIQNFEMMFVQN